MRHFFKMAVHNQILAHHPLAICQEGFLLLAPQCAEFFGKGYHIRCLERVTGAHQFHKEFEILSQVSRVIAGGKTRTESALAGVSEVSSSAKLIAIHDGARPLVTADVILRTVYAAAEHMAAAPAVPSVDTLKAVDAEGCIIGTVDRETTLRIQTPQIFRAELIKGALTKAVEKGMTLTDDCAAAEMMGVRTKTVLGDEDNIKITTPRDMLFAAEILKERGEYL